MDATVVGLAALIQQWEDATAHRDRVKKDLERCSDTVMDISSKIEATNAEMKMILDIKDEARALRSEVASSM